MQTIWGRLGSAVIGAATGLAIIALAIPLFLNPVWVPFEQDRTQAMAWTGFDASRLSAATGSILHDLVIGPPAFDVAIDGRPVLDERERQHMRDVRGVFIGFYVLTIAAVLGALFVIVRRRASAAGRASTWAAVRAGAIGLAVGLVVVGAVATVAFDALFETFHRVFFPGGSYTFDPRTERLVQLFPFDFWQETALVLGVVCLVGAGLVAAFAHRRVHTARWVEGIARADPATVATR